MRALVFVGCFGMSAYALATPPWDTAARRHSMSPELLYAVPRTELHLDAAAVNRSHRRRAGSYDCRSAVRHSIQEADLHEACVNLQVSAWLPADRSRAIA